MCNKVQSLVVFWILYTISSNVFFFLKQFTELNESFTQLIIFFYFKEVIDVVFRITKIFMIKWEVEGTDKLKQIVLGGKQSENGRTRPMDVSSRQKHNKGVIAVLISFLTRCMFSVVQIST